MPYPDQEMPLDERIAAAQFNVEQTMSAFVEASHQHGVGETLRATIADQIVRVGMDIANSPDLQLLYTGDVVLLDMDGKRRSARFERHEVYPTAASDHSLTCVVLDEGEGMYVAYVGFEDLGNFYVEAIDEEVQPAFDSHYFITTQDFSELSKPEQRVAFYNSVLKANYAKDEYGDEVRNAVGDLLGYIEYLTNAMNEARPDLADAADSAGSLHTAADIVFSGLHLQYELIKQAHREGQQDPLEVIMELQSAVQEVANAHKEDPEHPLRPLWSSFSSFEWTGLE